MAPKLYVIEASPPVRSVLMAAKAIGLELEIIPLDVVNGEHLKPEFLKINPQHTVPTLDDDGFIIWESHAINAYLVAKYAKDDSLYPKDIQKRAIVDQRLHFDTGVVFAQMLNICFPIIFKGAKSVPEEKAEKVLQGFEFLNKFLEGRKWVCGDDITIADFGLITTITSLMVLVPLDNEKYPNISSWLARAESLPYYDANKKGLEDLKQLVDERLGRSA